MIMTIHDIYDHDIYVMIIQILLNTDNNVYTTDYAHALKRKSKFKHKIKLLKTTYTIKQDIVEETQTLRTGVRGGWGVGGG